MNHNPENIQPGEVVRLDKGFSNSSLVKVVGLTPLGSRAIVHPAEIENPKETDMWDTMTYRLSREI